MLTKINDDLWVDLNKIYFLEINRKYGDCLLYLNEDCIYCDIETGEKIIKVLNNFARDCYEELIPY